MENRENLSETCSAILERVEGSRDLRRLEGMVGRVCGREADRRVEEEDPAEGGKED